MTRQPMATNLRQIPFLSTGLFVWDEHRHQTAQQTENLQTYQPSNRRSWCVVSQRWEPGSGKGRLTGFDASKAERNGVIYTNRALVSFLHKMSLCPKCMNMYVESGLRTVHDCSISFSMVQLLNIYVGADRNSKMFQPE